MTKFLTLLFLFYTSCFIASGQTGTTFSPDTYNINWKRSSAAVPTSSESVMLSDATITQLNLVFTQAGTCTVTDGAGTSIAVVTVTGAAWVPPINMGGIVVLGGIKWSCTVTGVIGYMAGKWRGN